ncbi:molecular chaperone [Rivularia sp. UHCC 0363]|uniref:molecular chaperone n=1 Tax=Rivularia sp. UHCC 0363 TaxID=3110244 RepID=UPI002B1FD8E2|nr:molecular chaperone [Rivularia sp. UHCC 0363]MEA5597108.1 molecular chaperone [Rivularia sp. UHCC 0363]
MTQSKQPMETNTVAQSTQPMETTTSPIKPNRNNSNEEPQEFPGWFAMDFGTSNSTVTLFDPINVEIPDILQKEQEMKLFELLSKWLSSPANKAVPGVNSSEWEQFLGDISNSLKKEPGQLHEVFRGDSNQLRVEAIRQIELCLGNTEKFRKAVSKKLYQIYHQVFRIPTLESQNLIPVVLDIDSRIAEIPSELEIISLNPLKVSMGKQVKMNKNNAIAQLENSSLEKIISKFHHSPKRYFGQQRELPVTIDGKLQTIAVEKLIQAAWAHLIELTENYRRSGKRKFSKGNFQTAVVTYPTVAAPIVRNQVKQLVKELGIEDVQATYDEAVAVVMFYLWREFGGYINIGIESFKTRCRREGDKWSQNVLVLDIGGGTTDIALIKLTLSDITPSFKNDKDRGLGGRYYEITPKLLGSSGHLQLGGELITLRIFRLLKVAIVDSLLSAIATGELKNDTLNDLIPKLDEGFIKKDGKYKQGSLLKCIDKERPENDSTAYKEALDAAEKVLPTRWKDTPQRLQTFYTLWDYAEEAKLKLGQKIPLDGSALTYTLSEQQISDLLSQVEINISSQQSVKLSVTLDSQQFERAAHSVIKEAVGIAKGLMESRLANNDDSDTQQEKIETEKVDWLILSGQTCNLDLVKREIYQQFSKSDYFLWNPERITFDPQFTKQGTSAGACYAEKMRRLKFTPEEAKGLLRQGSNQLRIDVQNLFYYLPCNFKRKTQSSDLPDVFKAGTELYQISPNDKVAKVRTEWLGIQLSNIIYRQDYERGQLQLWGSFNGNKLRQELQNWIPEAKNEKWFEEHIKIQFEIDSALNISILLCQEEPHYLIDGDGINVNQVIEQEALFDEGKLQWDIAVNVLESSAVDNPNGYHLVFEAVKDNTQNIKNKKFHYSSDTEPQALNGLISQPLPGFPESGKHTLYICQIDSEKNEKKWLRIDELSKPNVDTEFPCEYRVSLDENGMLRIHAGEVPYLESENKEHLKEEGYVFRAELELQPNEVNIERDPFSGIH